VKRGEIWTMAGGPEYAGKPRPVVIVQDDRFDETASVVICSFTTNPREAPLFRLEVASSEENGLAAVSKLMIDKIAAVPREKLSRHIGSLEDSHMMSLNSSLLVFLGLSHPSEQA
jgi:mRNA interferase MazF